MINRRNFQKVIGTSLLGATLTNPVSALTKPKKLKPKSNPLLHVGGDYHVVMSDDSLSYACLLYTSDAADERSSVDLGGRRIIKKKNTQEQRYDSVSQKRRTHNNQTRERQARRKC